MKDKYWTYLLGYGSLIGSLAIIGILILKGTGII